MCNGAKKFIEICQMTFLDSDFERFMGFYLQVYLYYQCIM